MLAIAVAVATSPVAAQGSIDLEIGDREAHAIDIEALRAAIARELAIEVRLVGPEHGGSGAIAVPRVRVRAIGRTRAVLELIRPDGSRMRRSSELHRDPAERLETIVILAVNMVRDEASELLELLRRRAVPIATGSAGEGGATITPEGGIVPASASPSPDRSTADPSSGQAAPPEPVEVASVEASAPSAPGDPSSTVASVAAAASTAAAVSTEPTAAAASEPVAVPTVEVGPAPPGHRVLRIGFAGLIGSVPRGTGYDATLIGGGEIAWTPEDWLAIGIRDIGGGSPLGTNGRWQAGAAAFAELGWILDPMLVLHLQLGVDLRANVREAEGASAGVAPMLVLGARLFPIREFSVALQTGLHVVVTDVWSSNLHVFPGGALVWTVGLTIAAHVS
jgi:hypothetical protein